MDSMAISHTPYVVILLKCLQEFKRLHNRLPISYDEKKQFKALISTLKSGIKEGENFDEAVSAAYRAYTPSKVCNALKRFQAKQSKFCLTQSAAI
jgi:amyloid beta precursor protein binding protein 1